MLAGRDLLAAAQTGTGKTAAFALPILQRLHAAATRATRRARAARAGAGAHARAGRPDRRVASRIYGRHLRQRGVLVFGGVSPKPQVEALRQRRRHRRRHAGPAARSPAAARWSTSSRVEVLVLDEADRMLDMGFIRPIRKHASPRCRRSGRPCCSRRPFRPRSASSRAASCAIRSSVDIAPRNAPIELIAHRVYHVRHAPEAPAAARASSTTAAAPERWCSRAPSTAPTGSPSSLERDGLRCAAIHGNKSQGARTRALDDFKQGKIQVLVATDIAARGLDIDGAAARGQLRAAPRARRTTCTASAAPAAPGGSGEAVSLVSRDERERLRAIEKMLGRSIPVAA